MSNLFDETEEALKSKGIDLTNYHTFNSTEKVLEIASAFGEAIYLTNLEVLSSKVSEFEIENQKFSDHMKTIWGPLLALSELLIRYSHECGSKYYSEVIEKKPELLSDPVFTCLTYFHGRSCQISSEILCLVKNGFASGAYARWRSLHENVVYAFFIKEYGPDIAQKYLDHAIVDKLEKVKAYRDKCSRLHHEPVSDEVVSSLEKKVAKLIIKYGEPFGRKGGWACEICKNPTFVNIEKETHMDHLNPYYRFASLSIHADSGACILENPAYPNGGRIPSGATIWGICDPCQNMAISLHQMNAAYFTYTPSILNLTLLKMFESLVDDIQETASMCSEISDQYQYS